MKKTMLSAISALTALLVVAALYAAEVRLRPDYPQRYVVKEGDTLWDIADMFLSDPWLWPLIWQQNQSVENPHRIYPGDVLVMAGTDADPRLKVLRSDPVKLTPGVRVEEFKEAIPTIPPGVIAPFITAPLIIDEDGLDDSGYVVVGLDDKILLGKLSEFYARNLVEPYGKVYKLFRPGDPLVHPDTREELGVEAIHLGDALMKRGDEISKLEVSTSYEEIGPGDRLLPADDDPGIPYYFPRAPDQEVRGYVLKVPHGVDEVGPFQVVILSLGEREGIEQGHVLKVRRHQGSVTDPVTGKPVELPEEDSGLVLVFRTFEKVSFAVVTKATRAIHLFDVVVTP